MKKKPLDSPVVTNSKDAGQRDLTGRHLLLHLGNWMTLAAAELKWRRFPGKSSLKMCPAWCLANAWAKKF
jgi:hypothetical protein